MLHHPKVKGFSQATAVAIVCVSVCVCVCVCVCVRERERNDNKEFYQLCKEHNYSISIDLPAYLYLTTVYTKPRKVRT
jgi:hypothetical protein